MRRGTSPTHTFTLPLNVDVIDDIRIIYAQDESIVLKKGKEDCSFEGGDVILKLSREDTWKFDCDKLVSIQLEVWTPVGDVLVSDIIHRPVDKCLDDEV